MKSVEPWAFAHHPIPDTLRHSSALAVAVLTAEGQVLDANRGFLRLMGDPQDPVGRDAAPIFVQPDFQTLLHLLNDETSGVVHRGILNLGLPGTTPASMNGQVYRIATNLLIVADHDAEEWERSRMAVLALNEALTETHRELVRDIQARKRAERELEETNRGIIALYGELNEKALSLQRASDLKSRFVSNMTHEFRTPLNAILILSELLLDRTDGDLTHEQQTQVSFIRSSAMTLSELVNDMLDMAKIEAGRASVHCQEFHVADTFRALRGMMRPLIKSDKVSLVFEDASLIPPLRTDEGKLSQILRNLVANALKFTEKGQITLSVTCDGDQFVIFSVADTGIGIDVADQERIFEEYSQIEGPLQGRYKGTGLGLPLSRQLATLLGGELSLTSRPGEGSTFRLRLPITYSGEAPDRENLTIQDSPVVTGAIPI